MVDATPNSAYSAHVLEALKLLLKPRGFRKKGNNFILERNDVKLCINVQKSMDSSKNQVVVTVNVGVYSNLLAKKLGYPQERIDAALEVDCHWRNRIGYLIPESRDKWWTIDSEESATRAAEEIARAVEDHGLPALEQLDATSKLHAYWLSGNYGGITEGVRKDYLQALAK